MAKKATVVITTEEWFDDSYSDALIEREVRDFWQERLDTVAFNQSFDIAIESIEQE